MKVAVVEKTKTNGNLYYEYFDFDFDLFALTKTKSQKVLKKDITLNESFEDYDFVILVGAEPAKHIAKVSNITKYAGQLFDNKYIPILNPAAVKFNPGLKDSFDVGLKKLKQHLDGTFAIDQGNYIVLDTEEKATKYLNKIIYDRSCTHVVVDIETSSLYPRDGYILGVALSHKEGLGYWIPSDVIWDSVEDLLKIVFSTKVCIFHNAKFDMKWLQYHYKAVFPSWEDTMLMHYLLNENEPHDLKSLVLKYTKLGDYDAELEEFKRTYCKAHKVLLRDFSYEVIPTDIMYKYAAADADGTIRLNHIFKPLIDKFFTFPYESLLKRGTKFLLDIEEIGVPFSKEKLLEAAVSLNNEIQSERDKLYDYPEVLKAEEILGTKFNPNSTAHLRLLFFDLLKLNSIKKTPKGEKSTDKEVLDSLAKKHPIPALIKNIRSKVKLKSTYIDKVLAGLDSDGRLRTGFHLHTVTSGRLSSSGKLNMQQLPRDDKTVKYCISPTSSDYVIFSQDLKTAEMYYAAVLSKDKNLAKVFSEGQDFHSSIAKLVFNLTCKIEEVATKYPDLRQASKAVSFGILYGAGPGKVASTVGISIKEAQQIINQYFNTFPQLDKWLKNTREEIIHKGCTYSILGRKRRVAGVYSIDEGEQGHAVRSALNFKVQSLASDANLLAAMDTHDWIIKNEFPAEIFALVHDSIIGQVRVDKVEEFKDKLKYFTQLDRGFSIPNTPIGVDFGFGNSYAEAA